MQVPAIVGYLNGHYAPLEALQVSVLDRGFLFGDGVYELIPVYDRQPFRLGEHLARLETGLAEIGMSALYASTDWQCIAQELIRQQSFVDQSLYLQVTRGPAWPRNHAFPEVMQPTVFAYAEPLLPPATEQVEQGVSAITAPDIRWSRCNIKTCSLIANVLLKQRAAEAGAAEVILLRDGLLIEGGASNIFLVKNGVILSPPPSAYMLTGITYDVIQELAQAHDLPLVLRAISEAELRAADEIWICSSSKEILAVVELDGQVVGNGIPGPIYRGMYDFYQAFKVARMRPAR